MYRWIKTNISDYICTVTINNPPLNILTKEFRDEFVPFMESLKSRDDVRVIVITGEGEKAFSAGADLNEEEALTQESVKKFLEEDCRNYDVLNEMPQPVIAAVNGYAFGGGFELMLAADLRILSDNAKLCAAGVKVGLVVSTTRLTRLIGEAGAKDIILTGKTINAEEAYKKGLASKVVPQAELMDVALKQAEEIASRAPVAVRKAKEAIQKTLDMTWKEAMSMELDKFVECQATWDHKHAIESFFHKRQPQFKGR